MAQSSSQIAATTDGAEAADIDALMKEREPRKVQENNTGSLSSTLNKDFCEHVGIRGSSPVQLLVHSGVTPVLVDEQCIIIRPHPEAADD